MTATSATASPIDVTATSTSAIPSAWYDSLDSCEGVPKEDLFSPRVPRESRKPWQRVVHDGLAWAAGVIPGVALAAGLALAGSGLSWCVGRYIFHFKDSPVSPILFAVFLGLLVRNTIGVPAAYEQGLKLCLRTILRLGIVLLGLRLSLAALGELALVGLPIIIACILTALLFVTWACHVLRLPRRLGALIAVGTSICGVSAIVATAPAIDAKDDEVSYAVGCITVFGMIALLTYPFAAHWLFPDQPQLAGLLLGTAIHDTSQVAGAGLMYQQQYGSQAALDAAVVSKLVRNVCMAAVIPIVAFLYHRRADEGVARYTGVGANRGRQPWHQIVPLFVLGFVAMVIISTLAEWSQRRYGLPTATTWHKVQVGAKETAAWCLATAMAAVGLGTGLAKLRGLGWKPLTLACAAALLVGGVSVALVKLLGPLL
jgi:uncharacterized integral membrane protein (TIGR00698 family)